MRNGVARFHGITVSTMMRGEAFGFYLLGTCVERADMTARILDVKYHLLLPDVGDGRLAARLLPVGGAAEVAVGLRGVSAATTRPACGRSTSPSSCIFERDFPRSLRFSVDRMRQALREIGTSAPTTARAATLARARRAPRAATADAGLRQSACTSILDEFLARGRRLQRRRLRDEYFEQYLGDER